MRCKEQASLAWDDGEQGLVARRLKSRATSCKAALQRFQSRRRPTLLAVARGFNRREGIGCDLTSLGIGDNKYV